MKKGFTLVELIVVVIIIGILAAVGIPQYVKALERSRGAEAYAGLGNIQQGEKLYFANNEAYYATAAQSMTSAEQQVLDISLPQTGWAFQVTSIDAQKDFTATAIRLKGVCSASGKNKITITNKGTITDTEWKACVDGL